MLISKKIRLEVSEQDAATLEADLLCVECGLVMDRDENSAVNILARYFARLGCAVVRNIVFSSQTRRSQWNILELMPYLTLKDEGENSMALKH